MSSSTGIARCPANVKVTLAQFDTEYEVVYAGTPIAEVPDFVVIPRGMTALLDAVGTFVTEIGDQLSAIPEDDRPGHVICLIMTDGMENSSHTWTWDAVKALTEQQQNEWNWTFIFIGANIDAIDVGGRMGFSPDYSITYDDSDYASTKASYTGPDQLTTAGADRRGRCRFLRRRPGRPRWVTRRA